MHAGRLHRWPSLTNAIRLALVTLCIIACAAAPRSFAAEPNAAVPRQHHVFDVDDLVRRWSQLPEQAKLDGIEAALKSGQLDAAERLMGQVGRTSPAGSLRLRYYRGVIHRARGELKQATDTFRELLAEHPDLARVRLELAHSLYLMNQDESAKHHFELLLGGSAADPNLERTVRGYISSIDSRRRWDFSSYVSLAPSTNINQGAQKRDVAINGLNFQLADPNVQRRGVGLLTGFHGSYRHPVTESWDLVATAGLHLKRFKETDFNNMIGSVSFGPRWRHERGFIGLYAIADDRWIADETYSRSWGYLLSTGYQFNAQNNTFNDVSCSRRSFDEDWRGSSLTYWNGHVCSISGRYEHSLTSTTLLRLLYGAGRENTGFDHLDNRYFNIGAGVYREFGWGINTYAQAQYTRKFFGGDFPGTFEKRLDDRYDLSLFFVKRNFEIFGLAPMLQYTYTVNASNVELAAFDAHGVNLTMTKKF